ncbi:MAG: hypothetical protein E7Z89_04485 [Cyanobacteria bacterium SIG28]|nr:hypothetical protein [Cyanobacteria bacterium SIG28]
MKINNAKINFFRDVLKPAIKNMFNFKHISLERSPKADTVEVNKFNNTPGIKSNTFKKLLTPEFMPTRSIADNGTKVTTLIDKKTQKPVEAFVAKIEETDPFCERYVLLVNDEKGDISIQNEKFKTIGETYFYVDKEKNLITPKSELAFIDGELCEKVLSHMSAGGNNEYGGIGTRLHQLRVERMLQNGLGNVCIVAEGNSFPFHYAMGYRLPTHYTGVEDAGIIMNELTLFNKKHPRENSKYLAVEVKDKQQVINISATIENCLNDYYKQGGKPLEDFSPNMYLDKVSLNQWIELIQKQPILY